jgi:hypothetical protein
MSSVRVLSWHVTALRTSSLASGNDGIGPRRLIEHSLASIAGMTAANFCSTALAHNVSRSKIPAECQGTNWQALACARARLSVKFPPRKCQQNPVFVDDEGYPCFVQFGLLFFLLQSRSSLAFARLMMSIVSQAMGSSSMLGANDPTGIYLNPLALLSPKVSAYGNHRGRCC